MTTSQPLGIPGQAVPEWVSLAAALDRLADEGRAPVCAQRPEQWSSDAKRTVRADAAASPGT